MHYWCTYRIAYQSKYQSNYWYILFVDFGPILEGWEADFGRTYVIGNNPDKHKLKTAVAPSLTNAVEAFKL